MTLDSEAVVVALCAVPTALENARRPPAEGGVPAKPGFYAWWAEREAIPGVPEQPHPTVGEVALFYVGISPSDPPSSQHMRARVVGNHISGNTGSSTFRLTLASLLLETLDLHPQRTKTKVVLPAAENERLSEWQREHLSLTWCEREAPWEIEGEVIAALAPPLNLAQNAGHPFHATLTSARRAFRAAGGAEELKAPPAIVGNKAIEDAAIAWVMEYERSRGREARDTRYRGAPADIESDGRLIEVKAFGTSNRGYDLWLETRQVEEARRNASFYVYVVENVRQGEPAGFTLKILGGDRLRGLLQRAKEQRYYTVPWPVADYDLPFEDS